MTPTKRIVVPTMPPTRTKKPWRSSRQPPTTIISAEFWVALEKRRKRWDAYQKSAELEPANAAQAWRNAGITLYNAGKMKEAVEPLKKATEIDPKSAQAWYLLGASLVGAMEYKQVGDKMQVTVLPGTLEAYQKAVESISMGRYGQQAKQGIEALAAMDKGIETKVKGRQEEALTGGRKNRIRPASRGGAGLLLSCEHDRRVLVASWREEQ